MRKYLKYIVMGVAAALLSTFFFPKKVETTQPRDYAEISESGILRAVTEYNTISYHADEDTITGFHYELLKTFAQSQGLQSDITPEMSFEERWEGVLTGKFDILADGTVVTSESKDSLLFTHPIFLTKQVLVQRKMSETKNDSTYIHSQLDLAHKTLHVVKGSPALLRIRNLGNEIGDTIYVKEIEKYGSEQLMALVAHGEIDYAVCDESIAEASLSGFPQLDIKTPISFTQFYSWGVSKDSPVLRDSLNAWLDRYIQTPEFQKLLQKYYKH